MTLLSKTNAAATTADKLNLFSSAAKGGQKSSADAGQRELENFVGDGSNDNAASSILMAAQIRANNANTYVSGRADLSSVNVEDFIGFGLLLKQLVKQGTKIGVGEAAKGVGQGFNSFSAFKRAMGPAGPGQAWHHIVEQTPGNIAKFGNQAVHNTGNLMKLPHGAGTIHARVSGHYSSIQPFTNGQTVRQWLSTQSFQAQYDYGIQTLKNFGWTP